MTSAATTHHPIESEDMPRETRLDDVRIRQVRPLISPALLQDDYPADAAVQAFVEGSRPHAPTIRPL
jgi:3-deoxy-7-phosphoheptulonate synthase